MPVNITHPKFYPVGSLNNKRNFKRIARILPDGSIIERIYLDVPDMRQREYLVLTHYLRHIAKHFLQCETTITVLGRDNPWDFRIRLNNDCEFNVEITSIADNEKQFEIHKNEERLKQLGTEPQLPLHELIKLAVLFPDENLEQLVKMHKEAGITTTAFVPNPFFPPETKLFLSTLYDSNVDMAEVLKDAITRKASKKHGEKNRTVLIIDNRSGKYDVPDLFKAVNEIEPLLAQYPFPEIWFYTGYYSNNDGSNAEFSFSPIKISPEQSEILTKLALKADEHGTYYW